jgi:hypothetical protein
VRIERSWQKRKKIRERNLSDIVASVLFFFCLFHFFRCAGRRRYIAHRCGSRPRTLSYFQLIKTQHDFVQRCVRNEPWFPTENVNGINYNILLLLLSTVYYVRLYIAWNDRMCTPHVHEISFECWRRSFAIGKSYNTYETQGDKKQNPNVSR